MPSIITLSELGRYRWTVQVMAFAATQGGGARFVPMAHALGVPRESLSRTLEAAIRAGWLIRNPGHGHPLRPDYILTPQGHRVGEGCRAIAAAQAAQGLGPDALTRWSLPVIWLIAEGESRFNAIARAIAGVTPRALTGSLKGLVGHALISRRLVEGFPPSTRYALASRGEPVARALERIAA